MNTLFRATGWAFSLALVAHLGTGLGLLEGGGAAAATAAELSHAARAETGTMTYIKAGNVWVALADGSSPRQVTSTGTAAKPWRSPTQSQTGTIVASRAGLIYRMDQWGTILNVLDPPNLRSGGGAVLGGAPSHVAVSPDGTLIAYSYAKRYCSTTNVCRVWPVTGFTAATRVSDPDIAGTSYGDAPAWVTKSRVVLDSRGPFDNIYLYEPGRGPVGYYWFDDANVHTDDIGVADVEVSLGSPYGVGVRGEYDQARIVFYDFTSTGNFRTGIPAPIDWQMCETSPVEGIGSPTFSADGTLAAWHEPDGVWTVAMGSQPCQRQPVLAIASASQPSMSGAALQSSRPKYRFKATQAPAITGTARPGRTLRLRPGRYQPVPTTIGYRWIRDGVPIKAATRASYQLTSKDKGRRIAVKVTVSAKGVPTKTFTSRPVRVAK